MSSFKDLQDDLDPLKRAHDQVKELKEAINNPARKIDEIINGPARKIKMLTSGGIFQGSGSADLIQNNQINEAKAPCALIESEGEELTISRQVDLEPQRPEAVDRSLKTEEDRQFYKDLAQRKPEGKTTIRTPAPVADDLSIQQQLVEIKAAVLSGNGKTESLVGLLTTSVIYLHFEWRDGYFKIGHSDSYEKPGSGKKGKGRKDTHESVGLEYIAHAPALKIEETKFKNLMKGLHKMRDDDLFKPKRKSDWEQFYKSQEFIDVLRAFQWPGHDQDLERFLKYSRQGELGI